VIDSPALWVALGGALGALARYFLGVWAHGRFGADFPVGTLIINVSGCFAIALFLTVAGERIALPPQARWFFPVGFVGAYTTFSTYGYEILKMLESGRAGAALLYFAASNVVGLGAVWLGIWLGRR
jgi:fluoride exporter